MAKGKRLSGRDWLLVLTILIITFFIPGFVDEIIAIIGLVAYFKGRD